MKENAPSGLDGLTGLKRRGAFQGDLRVLHAERDWRRAGLLLVDLDHLGAVNAALGHAAGDAYLRLAAESLRSAAIGHEGYRAGGDELVLLVREAEDGGLSRLAARVQAAFAARRPDWPVPVSLSIGYAAFAPDEDRNLYDTYARAQRALYAQKGRCGA